MAKLKHDKYPLTNNKGKTSFYGVHHIPAKILKPRVYFETAIDDVYGEHILWGDEAKARKENKCSPFGA